MKQIKLAFTENASPDGSFREITMIDAKVVIYDSFYSITEAAGLFDKLHSEIAWQQEHIHIYGKKQPIPRLTAWYGDEGKQYRYSGIMNEPLPWTELLSSIRNRIQDVTENEFNSVLLNLYRSGKDGLSWHQDDEPELGNEPFIASLSLGENRTFQMRHKYRSDISRIDIPLSSGSLLIMSGTTQRLWQHRMPKTSRSMNPRINLTFRKIIS